MPKYHTPRPFASPSDKAVSATFATAVVLRSAVIHALNSFQKLSFVYSTKSEISVGSGFVLSFSFFLLLCLVC